MKASKGKDSANESDEFLEKFQTAFDMVAFVQGGMGQIVSVNINTIVEKKYTLNPEITLLFINFMLKKPCLKFPKLTA